MYLWSTTTLLKSRLCMRGVAGCFNRRHRMLRNREMPPTDHQSLRVSVAPLIMGILLNTLPTLGSRSQPPLPRLLPRCSMRQPKRIRLLRTTSQVQSCIGRLKHPDRGSTPRSTGLPRDYAGSGGSSHRDGASKERVKGSTTMKTARTLEACGGIAWSLMMIGMRRTLCSTRNYQRAWNGPRTVWTSPAARKHVDVR